MDNQEQERFERESQMAKPDQLEMESMQIETSLSEISTPVLMNNDSDSAHASVISNGKEDIQVESGNGGAKVTAEGKVIKAEINIDTESVDTISDIRIVTERTEYHPSSDMKPNSPAKEPELNDSKVDHAVSSAFISPHQINTDIINQNLTNSNKASNAEVVVIKTEPRDIDITMEINVNAFGTVDHTESEHEPSVSSGTDHRSRSESISEVTDVISTGEAVLVLYSSSDEESSSDSSSTTDSDSEVEVKEVKKPERMAREDDPHLLPQPLKTKKELMFEDLPAVPYVDFRLADNEEVTLLGKVSSIIGQLVVVGSDKDTPALNEETVLFGKNRHPIGVVFEIFGPVLHPFYTVRFNSTKDIDDIGLTLNDDVYFAPRQEEITKYIFLKQLKAMKGSDASWANDEEPPKECLDYSDDEQEKSAKKKKALADGKRKDARRRDENGQPENEGQEGYTRRPATHGPIQGQNNSRGHHHHHQYRGPPPEQHQNQQRPFNQRGPPGPSQRHPHFQGSVRHHRPEWQQGVHYPPPNGHFDQMQSNFPPRHSNFVRNRFPNRGRGYGVHPPNMYDGPRFPGGPMHNAPPPMMPYSALPPFGPPIPSQFSPRVPPPVHSGFPPGFHGNQHTPH